MGLDDDEDCVEHVWALTELDLSVERGAQQAKHCVRCPAVLFVPDPARATVRPEL
ncbi:MAG: hypothetical protein JWQ74_462 [Marmoricola sp.]|nr:hypothetical protein [Marmoricola sp.]